MIVEILKIMNKIVPQKCVCSAVGLFVAYCPSVCTAFTHVVKNKSYVVLPAFSWACLVFLSLSILTLHPAWGFGLF